MKLKKLLESIVNEVPLDLADVDDPFEEEFLQAIQQNKKRVIAYHGTSTRWFWSIANKGFEFSEDRKTWENTTAGNYFSFDRHRAIKYGFSASNKHGGKPIVFVVELPVDKIERDMDDTDTHDKGTNYQTVVKDNVEPRNIVAVLYTEDENDWMFTTQEIPIKKFIQQVNKGKYPDISPESEQKKRKFNQPTRQDIEHKIALYVQDLITYTSFEEYNFPPKSHQLTQIIIKDLQSQSMSPQRVMNWNGEDWVKYLEKRLSKKNEEDYYKQKQEFQVPLRRIINKYGEGDYEYKKFRLGQNPKNPY